MSQTFRYAGPARQVALVGEMNDWTPGATPLARGPDGAWSVTVPLEAGQWLYKLWVDGQWIADPANPLSSPDGQGGWHSWVVVGEGDFLRRADAPPGRVEAVRVPSRALGAEVEANLYLPPGAPGPHRALVLLHGSGMDRRQWTDNGRISDFMDNLLHAGRIRPMAVLMPSLTPWAQAPGLTAFLAEELPAWLRASALVLGGYSLGGGQVLQVAAERPGAYDLYLPISAWVPEERLGPYARAAAQARQIVHWCGREDARLVELNRRIAGALRAAGARAEYLEPPGGHTLRFLNAITPELLERAAH